MSHEDSPPRAKPAGATDPMSSTDMFRKAFETEPAEEQTRSAPAPAAVSLTGDSVARTPAQAAGPGEFTQLFGAHKEAAPASVQPTLQPAPLRSESSSQTAEEATRIFVRQPLPQAQLQNRTPADSAVPPPIPRKGFSASGVSDSASDDGTFSRLFKTPSTPSPSTPVAPVNTSPQRPGEASDLFRVIPPASPVRAVRDSLTQPAQESPSITQVLSRLSSNVASEAGPHEGAPSSPPSATIASGGEFDRIVSVPAAHPAPVLPQPVAVAELPKPAIPKPTVPTVTASESKLQQMLPILLVLNGFLLVVLIVLVVFVLLRK